MSTSLKLAKELLNKNVEIIIDRPMGSRHPKHGFEYLSNYGYVVGLKSPDGEELDAYYLGVKEPVDEAKGTVIAIVHRLNDDDDKLVVVPDDTLLSDDEIEEAINFQEKWFKHTIIRI